MGVNLCINCKFAEWERTKDGKLHPSGAGRCTWQMPEIQLPASMYFFGSSPKPMGGYIERKEQRASCPQFDHVKQEDAT